MNENFIFVIGICMISLVLALICAFICLGLWLISIGLWPVSIFSFLAAGFILLRSFIEIALGYMRG